MSVILAIASLQRPAGSAFSAEYEDGYADGWHEAILAAVKAAADYEFDQATAPDALAHTRAGNTVETE